jgi:hypothetical protein
MIHFSLDDIDFCGRIPGFAKLVGGIGESANESSDVLV